MEASKNALVLYYSRTGNCRAVAEAIGETMHCPVQEIKDLKNRGGFLGIHKRHDRYPQKAGHRHRAQSG